MKKNLYYHTVYGRRNVIKEFILSTFLEISSGPRLLLEVFTRTKFGERYFSFSSAIILTLILAIYPIVISNMPSFDNYAYYGREESGTGIGAILSKYFTWYAYLGAFMYQCFKRREEIKREPSVFDFARFSLSTGVVNPAFLDFKINGKTPTPRQVSILLEPAIFLGFGILLAIFQQSLGYLLIFCSITYSLSWKAAFYRGDQFIMDKIDELIANEEMTESFIHGRRPEETRGFETYGRRPENTDFRRKVAETFFEYDDDEPVKVY